ncbi:TonB-dependent receptor plug domain-containing protein [Sphingomonas sp.]|uniref:TonB-dependent receptor plug domain-containing protein n=1 Tax=Sphingomonas sp. TaxID=28214 RepID=UPI0035BC6A39
MNRYTISLTAFAAAFATPALAQSDPAQAATDAAGDTVVVTASRSGDAVAAADVPASITVLDAAAIEQRQTRVVSDVLRDVPGLSVNRAGTAGGLTQVRVRGTEANHVLVLVDGIEVADPFQGEFDFAGLLADPSARIEVLRGQQSALYGSDAIGGVIQYITATGRDVPGVSARIEGGSFGTVTGAARGGGVAGALDYAVSGAAYLTSGVPTARGGTRDVGSDSYNASAKVTWAPSDTFKLTGVARYSNLAADTNGTEFDPASPRFGTVIDLPGSRFKTEAIYGLVRAELALADGRWTNALTGQVASTARDQYTAFGYDFGDRGQRYKGSFESAFRFDTGAATHRITGAVDVERERFRNTTPSNFVFQGYRHTGNVGIVGQYELNAGGLALGGSVRHDGNTRFADTTTWRVQGGYRLAEGTRLRGAYGTGVKNPGYYELYGFDDGRYIGNPDLKPETSKGWEAGLDQTFGRSTIGATYFDSKLENEVFTAYDANFVATPGNRTTLSRQHGVEAFVSARPIDQLRFDLAYTYTRSRENGVQEVRRPRHVGSVNVTGTSRDARFAGTLSVRYNGRQQDDAFTDPSFAPVRVSLQEYVLVNLNVEYKLTPAIAVFGRVENLFDEHYEEVFSYATAGRGAYGGVRARF